MAPASYIELPTSKIASRKGGLAIPDHDILTGLLYDNHTTHLHSRGHDDHDHIIISSLDDHAVVPSFPSTGTHTPRLEYEDEAVLSDIPSESESDLEIPPSPPISQRRHRNATSISSDDSEFPIFLGRQDEELVPSVPTKPAPADNKSEAHSNVVPVPSSDFDFPIFLGQQDEEIVLNNVQQQTSTNKARPNQPIEGRTSNNNEVPVLASKDLPTALSGPMMSWWPTSVDKADSSWIEEAQLEMQRQHLMDTWWRKPMFCEDGEWNERFYE